MTYKVVSLPSNIEGEVSAAAKNYEDTINQYASEGYKLITVTTIQTATKSGCMKKQIIYHNSNLLIFGRE